MTPVHVLNTSGGGVDSCAFAPTEEDSRLATSSDDGSVQIWQSAPDGTSWSSVSTAPRHKGFCLSLAWSPDGCSVASGGEDKRVVVGAIDAEGRGAVVLEGHTDLVSACSFSIGGDIIASASGDCTTRLWDVRTGECARKLVGHSKSVMSCNFSPDGLMLVTTDQDGLVKLWEVSTGGELQTLGQGEFVLCTVFTHCTNPAHNLTCRPLIYYH